MIARTEKTICDFLFGQVPDLLAIYLFGSFNTPSFRLKSDIDIAILTTFNQSLSSKELFRVGSSLAAELDRDIDLVDLRKVKLDFKYIILSTGRRLFCLDKHIVDSFELTTYSMYQRFEIERKPIVEAVKKRGFING